LAHGRPELPKETKLESFAILSIRLEFACNNTLSSLIWKPTKDVNIENLRFHWAGQIADTLRFLHSIHIIHRDLTCDNIFLDKHLNAKLGDFGCSSLDGSALLVEVTASHKYPVSLHTGMLISAESELYRHVQEN
jgi:serine/threonine protein kinase